MTLRRTNAYQRFHALPLAERLAYEAAWDAKMLKEAELFNAYHDALAAEADARDAEDELPICERCVTSACGDCGVAEAERRGDEAIAEWERRVEDGSVYAPGEAEMVEHDPMTEHLY